MSGSMPLTKENLDRFNDLTYGVPFGGWGDLKSELSDDSSVRSSQMESDPSDDSSDTSDNLSEASFNSRFASELADEDYSYSLLDSLKSKARTLIRSTKLPSTWKKCTLLAGALIGAGIALGVVFNKFNSNKSFVDCAKEGFDSALNDAVSILTIMDVYSNRPIFKYCYDSLREDRSKHFGRVI